MVDYDAQTALIVVDVQNDFGHPDGSLYVRHGEEVVAVANAEIARARAAGSTLVYTQDWHPASTPHFQKDGGIWPVHCLADSWGAGFVDGLIVEGEIIHKGTEGEDGYSAFTVRDPLSGAAQATRLGSLLEARRIRWVVVLGIATDYCVKDTVLDARRLGFETTVLGAGIHAVDLDPGDGDRALAEMRAAGAEVI
jgi:nicotinamidase/pyrazinamidase